MKRDRKKTEAILGSETGKYKETKPLREERPEIIEKRSHCRRKIGNNRGKKTLCAWKQEK
jgi:hypothetical protein